MTTTQQIEEARYCIDVMKKIKTFKNHKIGISKISSGFTLQKDRIVIYKEEKDGTVTTEYAHDKETITKNLSQGNLNVTCCCINVPISLICPIANKFRFVYG
jgi:hypothetical protein